MRAVITLDAYETAQRELALAHARTTWHRQAVALAAVAGALIFAEVVWSGAPWFAYLALSLWAVALGVYYRRWVRHGDERIREQQFRVEWRAGRSSERLTPRA
jgi:hypothetical protein